MFCILLNKMRIEDLGSKLYKMIFLNKISRKLFCDSIFKFYMKK